MSAYQPVPTVAQLTASYKNSDGSSKPMDNVFHLHSGAPWSVAALAEAADAFESWEAAHGAGTRSNEVELQSVRIMDLGSPIGNAYGGDLAAPVPGTVVSPVLPSNATIALHWAVGGRGRGRSGRTFIIGLAENQVAENRLTVPTSEAILVAYGELATFEASAGFQLCIVHRYVGGAKLPSGTYDLVDTPTFRDLSMDSRRLRLPGERRRKKKV